MPWKMGGGRSRAGQSMVNGDLDLDRDRDLDLRFMITMPCRWTRALRLRSWGVEVAASYCSQRPGRSVPPVETADVSCLCRGTNKHSNCGSEKDNEELRSSFGMLRPGWAVRMYDEPKLVIGYPGVTCLESAKLESDRLRSDRNAVGHRAVRFHVHCDNQE